MTKNEFILRLADALKGLPREEADKSLSYYSEMVDDRMDDGMNEEEAVASLGDPEEIADKIKDELPFLTAAKARVKSRERKGLVTVMLILGFPLWFSMLAVFAAVMLVIYVCIWAVDAALWSAVAAFAAAALGCLVGSGVMFITGFWPYSFFVLGGGLVSAGIAALLFLGVLWSTKQMIRFSAWLFKKIRRVFFGRKVAR